MCLGNIQLNFLCDAFPEFDDFITATRTAETAMGTAKRYKRNNELVSKQSSHQH